MGPWSIALPGLAAATGVFAWGAMHPASQLFGPTLRRSGRANAIALTFDDGPNPVLTPRLLDLLDRYQVRATFFLIGKHVRVCASLAGEIRARGHVLGNHTETHPALLWLSRARIREELQRCQEAIAHAAGHPPQWMRPPYGCRGPHLDGVVRQVGLLGVVMWSRLARDWKPQPAERVIRRLGRVRGGEMVALHDGGPHELGADRRHTLAALEVWLPRWRDAGLQFVTLEDIRPSRSAHD